MLNYFSCLVFLMMPVTVLSQFADTSVSQANNLVVSLNVVPSKIATLSWKNDPLVTSGYFVVERRSDSGSFEPMASMKISAQSFDYKLADEKPFPGINHYRIKLVDGQGMSSYSVVVTGDLSLVSFCRFYPNPADDHLIISATRQVEIRIFNKSGSLALSKVLEKGLAALDVSSLSKGIYILVVISTETKTTMREILFKN